MFLFLFRHPPSTLLKPFNGDKAFLFLWPPERSDGSSSATRNSVIESRWIPPQAHPHLGHEFKKDLLRTSPLKVELTPIFEGLTIETGCARWYSNMLLATLFFVTNTCLRVSNQETDPRTRNSRTSAQVLSRRLHLSAHMYLDHHSPATQITQAHQPHPITKERSGEPSDSNSLFHGLR